MSLPLIFPHVSKNAMKVLPVLLANLPVLQVETPPISSPSLGLRLDEALFCLSMTLSVAVLEVQQVWLTPLQNKRCEQCSM